MVARLGMCHVDSGFSRSILLVEWQGYRDSRFLPRVLFYLAWLLLHRGLPVLVTIVYLKPGGDTGNTFRLELDGREYFAVPFHRVRLWEEDAGVAIASGRPGLAVLSALMAGCDAPRRRSLSTPARWITPRRMWHDWPQPPA